MPTIETRPFGSWPSPITAEAIASGAMGLSEVRVAGEDVYWIEMRPAEGGRSVVVRRRANGCIEDCIPPGFSARTRVHEYGGGSYLIAEDILYFVNFADQRVYRVISGAGPEPITPPGPLQYADLVWDGGRRRILCVREDHSAGGEPTNTIVAIPPDGSSPPTMLAAGRDFYAAPRPSPDGTWLAFLAWNHPHMPWDAAELWLAPLRGDGSLGDARHIAGGHGESAIQPLWAPDGSLCFVCDRTDWWNLYAHRDDEVRPLASIEAEFGTPPWVFGMQNYAFSGPGRILCSCTQRGIWTLAELNSATGKLSPISLPYTDISSMQWDGRRAVFLAGAPDQPLSVIRLDLETRRAEVLRRASALDLDPAYFSAPEPIEFLTTGGLTAHALFYPPSSPACIAPPGEKPPLVVMIHGGPTSMTTTALRLQLQYYTSRGIAVLDVNYGGSTGYGRTYRERLNEQWGVVDVDDCCAGAEFLAGQGRVDPTRLAIRGGSAGGYTTLACLAFRKVFAAGASHYGVSDLELLTKDTHKFEARYLDRLVGPYPERRDLYLARSPIHHLEGLDRPVIFFQGLDDKVVPPNQAERMFEALRARGVPTAYIPFVGEQHGFRKAENIRRAIEGEFAFFARIFGITPADPLPPLPIENL
jgi:dipeptidyl aminopeptidase/acylaminoacyl peptidase